MGAVLVGCTHDKGGEVKDFTDELFTNPLARGSKSSSSGSKGGGGGDSKGGGGGGGGRSGAAAGPNAKKPKVSKEELQRQTTITNAEKEAFATGQLCRNCKSNLSSLLSLNPTKAV